MEKSINKKIKFKISLAGIEFEAHGYGSEDAFRITKKVLTYISVIFILCFLAKVLI